MSTLVTTNWLSDHLSDGTHVVLDASAHLPDAQRDARAEFEAAHVPGARFMNLKGIGPTPEAPLGSDAHRELFAQAMGALGVSANTPVVFYDDSKLRSAARAWLIARLYGMQHLFVLDGGLGKWRAEGRPFESGMPQIAPVTFSANAGAGAGAVRTKADMLANLDCHAEQVVDARDAARFAGEAEDFRPGVTAGHIPGSKNLPFGELLAEDGTFKSPADIKSAFEAAGVDLSRPITTSCGSGITASVLLFGLDLIGQSDNALYDGSWSEWGADPATPKATGR